MSEASLHHWNTGGGHFFCSICSFEEEFQQRRRLQVREACWLKPRRSLLHSFTLHRRLTSGVRVVQVQESKVQKHRFPHGEVRSEQREIVYPHRTFGIHEEESVCWLEATRWWTVGWFSLSARFRATQRCWMGAAGTPRLKRSSWPAPMMGEC